MRFIQKGGQPEELIRWRAKNAETPQNLFYGGGDFPSEAVRKSLLREQFHLCAYTLRRLKTPEECAASGHDTRASCHIEHVLPQSRRFPGEDIDYENMLACFPPSQSTVACEFGASVKAGFDPSQGGFISPLSPSVETHFQYDERGGIRGQTAEGTSTIAILKLDHKILVNDRAAVIRGYLQPKGKKISAHAARRLAQAMRLPDQHRCLPKYCKAIEEAALKHAEKEERRSARLRGKSTK